MSFNDRCQEALDAMDAGAPIPDTPAVRAFVRAILREGVDGIRFAYGLRDVAREIRDGAPASSDAATELTPGPLPSITEKEAVDFLNAISDEPQDVHP